MVKLSEIKDRLQSAGMRVTQARLLVAKVLIANKSTPLSPEQIHQKTKKYTGDPCDQVSVYRALSRFTELKLATKNAFQGEAARYKIVNLETASKNKHSHEHFFKCRSCQKVESFEECFVSQKEKNLESAGYREISHHLEISGVCPSCVKSQ
jgi:Fe2+ or Zn2+ uptake regulation protein